MFLPYVNKSNDDDDDDDEMFLSAVKKSSISPVLRITLILSCSLFGFQEKDVPKVENGCRDCLRRAGFIPSFDTDQKQITIRTLVSGHVGLQCGRKTKFFSSRF